jgi:hypothetical protein
MLPASANPVSTLFPGQKKFLEKRPSRFHSLYAAKIMGAESSIAGNKNL